MANTHKTRTFEVEAWKFEGNLKKAPAWAKDKITINEDDVEFTDPGNNNYKIENGWMIIKNHHEHVIAMPETAFDVQFEPLDTTV